MFCLSLVLVLVRLPSHPYHPHASMHPSIPYSIIIIFHPQFHSSSLTSLLLLLPLSLHFRSLTSAPPYSSVTHIVGFWNRAKKRRAESILLCLKKWECHPSWSGSRSRNRSPKPFRSSSSSSSTSLSSSPNPSSCSVSNCFHSKSYYYYYFFMLLLSKI